MKRFTVTAISIGIVALSLNACYYDEEIVFQGLPTNVSLKNDVTPILEANCSITGCHDAAGSHTPSLTAENVYSSLINGNYVNVIEPEKSKIYVEMNEGGMPPSGKLGTNDLKIILGWITEGAQNN